MSASALVALKAPARSYYLDEPNLEVDGANGVDEDWVAMQSDPEFSDLLGNVCVPILMLKPISDKKTTYTTKKVSPYKDKYTTE